MGSGLALTSIKGDKTNHAGQADSSCGRGSYGLWMPSGGCPGGRKALLAQSMVPQLERGFPREGDSGQFCGSGRGSKQGRLSLPSMDLGRDPWVAFKWTSLTLPRPTSVWEEGPIALPMLSERPGFKCWLFHLTEA